MTPEEEIEKILGRELSPQDYGSIPDLNDFPPRLLAEARAIASKSKILAGIFVHYHNGAKQLGEVKGFVEDVVVGGQDPAAWHREPLLCRVSVDGSRLLELDTETVIALLQDIPGERWVRLVPQRADRDYSGSCGAPAVLNRTANYRWRSPDGVSALTLQGHEVIETVDDLTIAVRRWIASRVAWQLARKQIDLAPGADVSEVARLLAAGASLSADAEVAIRALLREERELGPSCEAVPGFRGPDEWYAS